MGMNKCPYITTSDNWVSVTGALAHLFWHGGEFDDDMTSSFGTNAYWVYFAGDTLDVRDVVEYSHEVGLTVGRDFPNSTYSAIHMENEDISLALGGGSVASEYNTSYSGRIWFCQLITPGMSEGLCLIRYYAPQLDSVAVTGQITSTLATSTAPLVVASTTNVANLNASYLNGAKFASPGAIGGGSPASGAFTSLSATGITNGKGLQAFSSAMSCTTTASVGAVCTTGSISLPAP